MVCLNRIVLTTPRGLLPSIVLSGVFETVLRDGFLTLPIGAIGANRANNPSAACLAAPDGLAPLSLPHEEGRFGQLGERRTTRRVSGKSASDAHEGAEPSQRGDVAAA